VVVVRSGLREGERVVVNGTFKIDSALQIMAKPSLMSAPLPGAPGRPERGPVGRDHSGDLVAPAGFRAGLELLYSDYFALAEALAADDAEAARAAASRLADAVHAIETGELGARGRRSWQRLEPELTAAVRTVAERSDLANERAAFVDVSRSLVALVETFGPVGGTFYRTHCPMAFDFQGADWLQRHETVTNPYFGAQMLHCGSVTGAYTPAEAAAGEERDDD
jgi:Cu(I)/Ag(I) efflux system membrane fusion protein